MGFLKRISGWLLKQNSVPYNRLIKGHTVSSPTDFADKDYVDEAYELGNDNLTNTIAAIMARMGLVIVPTNIALSPFPNPITVNGRNYTLVDRQRVLLIGQTNTDENGVYEVSGTSLVRISDLIAQDGIAISTNQISLKRWANALNALRFNSSGEAQVRVRNTGTNVFGGLQVDSSTGEIWIDETTLPGFAGSLSVEQLLAFIGVASKMNFSNDFALNWDSVNARVTVGINPDRAAFSQAGGAVEVFENSLHATSLTGNDRGLLFFAFQNNAISTFTHGYEYSDNVLSYGQISVNTNSASAGESCYRSTIQVRVNSYYNFYFKSRVKIITLSQTNTQFFTGLTNGNGNGNLPTEGVFFHAKKGVNNDRLRCIASKASATTIVNLGAGYENEGFGYRDFYIEIKSAEAKFYIDGVLVATISTNLPDTATNMSFRTSIGKTSAQISAPNDVIRCGLIAYYYEKA